MIVNLRQFAMQFFFRQWLTFACTCNFFLAKWVSLFYDTWYSYDTMIQYKQFTTVLHHVRREWALLSFHSVCLSVCWSFRDLQPTTIDRSQPDLVGRCPRTRLSFFGSPISHIFGARGKNMQNFAISNTLTVSHTKPYSSYNSWSSLLILGHSTLHRHTHRLTSAFLIRALMSKLQPFNAYSCHCEHDTLCHMTCINDHSH